MKPWRYHDQARELDDSLLADWESSKADAVPDGEAPSKAASLDAIIHGDSVCQEIEDTKVAAEAMAPELIAEHQARLVVRDHLEKRAARLDAFITVNKGQENS